MKPLQSKKTIFFLFFLVIGLAAGACEGPEGPAGPQGEQGPEGPVGPAGSDGSMIHSGEGGPDGDAGAVGDFYLDIASGSLYGAKTEDGWGTPVTLQGSEGPAGEDGSQILSGTAAPDNSTGNPGDYFLNKSTFDLYGPKTESGWGTPINLQATTNVMYTTWFEPDWNRVDDIRHKRMRITEFKLTSEFKERGIVLVYHRDIPSPGNLQDRLLPHTVYFVGGEVATIYRSEVIGNGIFIEVKSYTRDLKPWEYDAEHNLFRYVLIPGSEEIAGKVSGHQLPINLDNYKEVKKYYGLKEYE